MLSLDGEDAPRSNDTGGPSAPSQPPDGIAAGSGSSASGGAPGFVGWASGRGGILDFRNRAAYVTCNEQGAEMPESVSFRVRRHRDGLRAAGMRPIQIWVPDTRRSGFAAECRRQSLLVNSDPHERETSAWLDGVRDTDGWE